MREKAPRSINYIRIVLGLFYARWFDFPQIVKLSVNGVCAMIH